MKIKAIILLLIFSAVLLSGCVENGKQSSEKNVTPAETVTPAGTANPVETTTQAGNTTPVENITPTGNATPVETTTPVVNETTDVKVISTVGTSGTTYQIRLDNYRASTSSLEIKEGDTVAWINVQDTPSKRLFTLVSQEGLFNNTNLGFKRPFAYTFNETGNYNFTVVGQPRMNVSISVKEP